MITYFIVLVVVVVSCGFATKSCKIVKTIDSTTLQITRDTKVFLFFSIVALTVTSGLRYFVGTDYGNYIMLYKQYSKLTFAEWFTFDEPILPIIGNISYRVFDSYYPMFFIVAFITIVFALVSTYKETTDYLFVTLIYIFVGCWHASFNGIRQCMAVTIVYLSRRYILQRKFFKFLLLCFVAFLVHKSALFFILVYFVYADKVSIKRLLIIIFVTITISMNYETVFGFIGWLNDSEFVQNEYSSAGVSIFRILVGCAPAILGIYFAYNKKLEKEQVFYVYMLVANAAIRVATSDSAYLARLGAYTGILVPLGINSISKLADKRYYKILRIAIVLLYFAYWLHEITNSSTLREFEWIFGNI